jgi:hypothetical protein
MKPAYTVSEERLAQIYSESQYGARICEMSDVIAPLSNAELEAAYDGALMRHCREFAFGALRRARELTHSCLPKMTQAF